MTTSIGHVWTGSGWPRCGVAGDAPLRGAESFQLDIFARGGQFDAAAGPAELVQVIVDTDAGKVAASGPRKEAPYFLPTARTCRVDFRPELRARDFDPFDCFRKIGTRYFERSITAQRKTGHPIQLRQP